MYTAGDFLKQVEGFVGAYIFIFIRVMVMIIVHIFMVLISFGLFFPMILGIIYCTYWIVMGVCEVLGFIFGA